MEALLRATENLLNGTEWLFHWLTTPIHNIAFKVIGMDNQPPIMILSVSTLVIIFIYYTARALVI